MVTFPEKLDLRPYMNELEDGNDVYKLYAVIVHVDIDHAFGHYICYVKDFGGNWYRIDDDKVRTATFLHLYMHPLDLQPEHTKYYRIMSHFSFSIVCLMLFDFSLLRVGNTKLWFSSVIVSMGSMLDKIYILKSILTEAMVFSKELMNANLVSFN